MHSENADNLLPSGSTRTILQHHYNLEMISLDDAKTRLMDRLLECINDLALLDYRCHSLHMCTIGG
jgi:hypothetical protein